MKLLFDQNISFRAVKLIGNLFPQAKQLRELSLENATDKQIWEYAKAEQYSIVTFDADFYDLVTLYGHPPKVIWLRLGNTRNDDLIQTFETHFEIISAFLTDPRYSEISCLEIDS